MPRLHPRDRIFLCGTTGEGKSLLSRSLFQAAPAPKVVVDPVGSSMTAEIGPMVTFRDPTRLPDAAVTRFVPYDPQDLDAYEVLHQRLWARLKRAVAAGDSRWWSLWMWWDEAGMVMPVHKAPPSAVSMVVTGRKWNIGGAACHTRPREVHRQVPAQSQHAVIFGLGLDEDRAYVAGQCSISKAELDQVLDELPSGPGCVWWELCSRTLHPLELEVVR